MINCFTFATRPAATVRVPCSEVDAGTDEAWPGGRAGAAAPARGDGVHPRGGCGLPGCWTCSEGRFQIFLACAFDAAGREVSEWIDYLAKSLLPRHSLFPGDLIKANESVDFMAIH